MFREGEIDERRKEKGEWEIEEKRRDRRRCLEKGRYRRGD